MPIRLRREAASRSRRRGRTRSRGRLRAALARALDLIAARSYRRERQGRRGRRGRWQLPGGLAALPEKMAFLPDAVPIPPGPWSPPQDPYDVDRLAARRANSSARKGRAPRLVRLPGLVGAAAARVGRSTDRGSPRVFAVLLRATAMVAVLSAMAIWIATAGNLTPDGVRFSAATPTSQISAAGSVTEHAPAGRAGAPLTRTGGPSSPTSPRSTAAPTAALPAAAPCHISYSLLVDVPSRFTAVMVIANTSSAKVDGWTLRWDFPAKQEIIYGWNAIVSIGQGGAVATDIDSNQKIAPGESVTIGFVGKRQGWVPTPTGFTLNGKACQWQPAAALSTPSVPAPAGSATTPTVGAPPAAGTAAATPTGSPAITVEVSADGGKGNGNGNDGKGKGTGNRNAATPTITTGD